MAYTYADFERAANEAGLNDSFSESDRSIAQQYPEYGLSLVSLRRDLNKATTNEQKLLATEAENQLRKNYSGLELTPPAGQGTQASGSIPTQQSAGGSTGAASIGVGAGSAAPQSSATGITKLPAFSTKANAANPIGRQAPAQSDAAAEQEAEIPTSEHKEYTNQYQRLLDQAKKVEDFSFDPFGDPRYSAYKKAYNREGDRAAANALAQSAAATGGRPSSWSQTAAQEANNYYAAKLADIIPSLYDSELSEYRADYERALADAELRAQYGDFGGYADVFGPETAADMYSAWAAQNPDLAYLAGQLTPDQYKNLASGRPLNEGLDENGVRIAPLRGGGGYSGPALADILRGQAAQVLYGDKSVGGAGGDRSAVIYDSSGNNVGTVGEWYDAQMAGASKL